MPRLMSRLLVALVFLIVGSASASAQDSTGQGAAKRQSVGALRPFFEFQVEQQVGIAAGSPMPLFPAELQAAKVEGQVLIQFVVDTLGRAELPTVKVLKSSHPLFTDAVQVALPQMRFTPAEVGGQKVRQFVQRPFTFELPQ